jgi:hypothetical protein
MRTISVGVFEYSELSEKAKEYICSQWQEMDGYNWATEALDSLRKLAEHFDGRLTDWEISWDGSTYSHATFDMPDEELDVDDFAVLLGKLGSYDEETGCGHGDCVLTGYCMDEAAIDGLRQHWLTCGELDLNKLMQAAFTSLLASCQEDYEYQYSDEAMADTCAANGYEFYEDGEMV